MIFIIYLFYNFCDFNNNYFSIAFLKIYKLFYIINDIIYNII